MFKSGDNPETRRGSASPCVGPSVRREAAEDARIAAPGAGGRARFGETAMLDIIVREISPANVDGLS